MATVKKPGRRMGSGKIDQLRKTMKRVDELEKKASHVIHKDGTYSNQPSAVSLERVKVHLGQPVQFGGAYPGGGFVYEILDNGFWTRPRQDHAPELGACNFWTWEYANQHMRR